jgi:hypothetical protein
LIYVLLIIQFQARRVRESDVKAILEGLKVVHRRRPWSEQNRVNHRPRNVRRIDVNAVPRRASVDEIEVGPPEPVQVDMDAHENNPPEDMIAEYNIENNPHTDSDQDPENDSLDEDELSENELEGDPLNSSFVSPYVETQMIFCL